MHRDNVVCKEKRRCVDDESDSKSTPTESGPVPQLMPTGTLATAPVLPLPVPVRALVLGATAAVAAVAAVAAAGEVSEEEEAEKEEDIAPGNRVESSSRCFGNSRSW